MSEADVEPPPTNSLNWKKLFEMAKDPDIEEIEQGPIETAIKQLETGKEIQKLNAIRNFPELLKTEGDVVIEKILPAIQKLLFEERSNLDIHCEAAVVYKEVLKNDAICKTFPTLSDIIVENIITNVSGQKENASSTRTKLHLGAPTVHHCKENISFAVLGNILLKAPQILSTVSAAAWLETLGEILEKVPQESLKQYVIPVVQQQAESTQRVQRRIIAAKLIQKLAEVLLPTDVRKELGPSVQLLCKDPNSNVRTAMAQRLPVFAPALKNPSDAVSFLLPCFVELFKDDDMTVREASLNQLSPCLMYFPNECKRSTLFPLIRKTTEEALEKKDDTLMVVARHLGTWTDRMSQVLDKLDMSWVLNTYVKIAQLSLTAEANENKNTQSIFIMVRRMCAFNFPGMLVMFPKAFDRLQPLLEAFCTDSDDEVRISMAASYHLILERQGRPSLLQPFVELIRGGAPEVVAKITMNLDSMLPILYTLAKTGESKVGVVQLDRILIGCNQLLRGSGSWRGHEALLTHIAALRHVLSFDQLHENFVPILQKEALEVRAIPCRQAAVNTLLLFMREQPQSKRRQEILDFLRIEIAEHKCCYRRSLFLDAVECSLKIFSRRFFVEHLLERTLKMTTDKVSNNRLKALRMLTKVKAFLILPQDSAHLLALEKAMREAMQNEAVSATRQLMQTTACDLSRTETRPKSDTSDKKREDEEDRLWNEDERIKEQEKKKIQEKEMEERRRTSSSSTSSIEGDSPKPSGLKPPEVTRSVSPWRSQRRAIAVVRPQPVVVMRSASPAPGDRPSRLPLSTAARDKDHLKKVAESTGLPRPSPRRSSVISRSHIMSSSTSALESATRRDSSPMPSFGLRRSSTTSTGIGSISSTGSSYALTTSKYVNV